MEADEVFVGVTDGQLSQRARAMPPVEERMAAVAAFCQEHDGVTVRPLSDAMGPAATDEYDAIVVSPETLSGATRINETRKEGGLPALDLWVVPHVLGQDRLPISATAIAEWRIDRDGSRLKPTRVAVGSGNQVKINGVAGAFKPFVDAEISGLAVPSGVPEQPRGHETLAGARTRAVAAMEATGADYAVGVEAGLNQDDEGHWYDVQACVILDRTGHETTGWGPAFRYPDWVTERALKGEMISEILGPVADDPRIGGTTGAIGFLSDGAMDRTELTRVAVTMALVPRWHPELYGSAPSTAST